MKLKFWLLRAEGSWPRWSLTWREEVFTETSHISKDALKKLPGFLSSTFSSDVQAGMLGVKESIEEDPSRLGRSRTLRGGVDMFKSIRDKTLRSEALMESGGVDEFGQRGAASTESRRKAENLGLSAASDLEKLLRRSDNEGLADELKERIETSGKRHRGGEFTTDAKLSRMGLRMYMTGIQNDPKMQAFVNPEAMGAPQISALINAGSKYDKGDVSARIRAAQEGLTTAGLDSRLWGFKQNGWKKTTFCR